MAMADALRTLPALNRLLHLLAAAAGQQLRSQLQQRSGEPLEDGGSGSAAGQLQVVPVADLSKGSASLMPFTSAALTAGPTVSCHIQGLPPASLAPSIEAL
jgi:hypothetical protein